MTLFEWISNYYKRIYLTADITGFTPWPSPYSDRLCQCLSTEKGKKSRKRCHVVSHRGVFNDIVLFMSRNAPGKPILSIWISEMTVHTLKNMIAGVCCVFQVVRWLSHIPRIALLPFVWLCLHWRPDIESCFQFYSFPQFSHRLSTNQRGIRVVMSYNYISEATYEGPWAQVKLCSHQRKWGRLTVFPPIANKGQSISV